MNELYATFDPASIGASLALSNGLATVTTTADGLDAHRMVRGTRPQAVWPAYAEGLCWGSAALGGAYFGAVTASAGLDKYVGEDAYGFGLKLDTGAVYSNGAVVDTFSPVAKGQVLRMYVDPINATCTWWADGEMLGTVTITVSEAWMFAATLNSTIAGDLSFYVNAGQQAFRYDDQGTRGWWDAKAAVSALRFATAPYLSRPDDARPHMRFSHAVDRKADVRFPSGVHFWPWAGSISVPRGGGSLRLYNPDGRADALLTEDVRDTPIDIARVTDGVLDNAETLGTAVVDSARGDGDDWLDLIIKDRISLLDRALRTPVILPNADSSAAGRPVPVLIGGARQVAPILVDAAQNIYLVSDTPIGGIVVRDSGRILDPTAAPPEFVLLPDARHIQLDQPAKGTLTCSVSTTGAVTTMGTDLLAGGGHFDAMSVDADIDTYWTRGHSGGTADPALQTFGGVTPNKCKFPGDLTNEVFQYLKWSTAGIIQAGKSYRINYQITHMPHQSSHGPSGDFGGYVEMTTGGWSPPGHYVGEKYSRVTAPESTTAQQWTGDKPYSFTYTNATGVGLDFVLRYYAINNNPSWVQWVELYELPAANTVTDVGGVSLTDYCRRVIEDLGQQPATIWRSQDTQAIDDATGYLYGNWISSGTSIGGALQPAMDSCLGSDYALPDGTIGFVRLIDPEDVADVDCAGDLVDAIDELGKIDIWDDLAPGLTTRAAVQHNFATIDPSAYGDDTSQATGVTPETRRLLSATDQAEVASGVQLASCYQHAYLAKPLRTLFDKRTDGQDAIDHACGLYQKKRQFRRLIAPMPPGRIYLPGSVWRITHARYGYNRRKMFLALVDPNHAAQTAELTFWS